MRTIVIVVLTASAAIQAFLGALAYMKAKAKHGFYSLSLLCAAGTFSSAVYAVGLSSTTAASALLCLRFQSVALAAIPIFWLLLIREFTGTERANPNVIVASAIVPITTAAMVATAGYHDLFYVDPVVLAIKGLSVVSAGRGTWYWVYVGYFYAVTLFGLAVFVREVRHGDASRRSQAKYMMAGSMMPWLAGLLQIALSIPTGFDVGLVSMSIACFFFSYGFFKYRLLDIHPLARDLAFEQMRDAVFTVDEEGLVVDYNGMALQLLPELAQSEQGITVGDLVARHPGLEAILAKESFSLPVVFPLQGNGGKRYESHRSTLRGKGGLVFGEVYTLVDVTDREELKFRVEELASIDELTRIPNRQRFYELATIELDRARRYGRSISFAIMNLNGFKRINEEYGRRAGDEALRVAARLASDALRSCDVVGRLGSDEFGFVFPECAEAGARAVAEKLRHVVRAATFSGRESLVPLSARVGVVSSDGAPLVDLEEYLAVASQRMSEDRPTEAR